MCYVTRKRMRSTVAVLLTFCGGLAAASRSFACSSCGCTLSSDWASQGYATDEGFRVDLRFDYFDQTELRTGTGTVDTGAIVYPTDREIQVKTLNRNYTLALDYSPNANWGVDVLLPYFDRYHETIAEGDTDISTSDSNSIGDVRVLGRYQGFSKSHSTGIQFGLKLATGSIGVDFTDGPQAGTPLDRGLQPGTGTTDLLVGAYNFGSLPHHWGYFVQGLLQQPLNTREDFRPGTGLNANVGARWEPNRIVAPQLQLNIRTEGRESGANADADNSGATLVYLSPGITVRAATGLKFYGFFQVPVYQRVNGYQLEPRYTISIGLRYSR